MSFFSMLYFQSILCLGERYPEGVSSDRRSAHGAGGSPHSDIHSAHEPGLLFQVRTRTSAFVLELKWLFLKKVSASRNMICTLWYRKYWILLSGSIQAMQISIHKLENFVLRRVSFFYFQENCTHVCFFCFQMCIWNRPNPNKLFRNNQNANLNIDFQNIGI